MPLIFGEGLAIFTYLVVGNFPNGVFFKVAISCFKKQPAFSTYLVVVNFPMNKNRQTAEFGSYSSNRLDLKRSLKSHRVLKLCNFVDFAGSLCNTEM